MQGFISFLGKLLPFELVHVNHFDQIFVRPTLVSLFCQFACKFRDFGSMNFAKSSLLVRPSAANWNLSKLSFESGIFVSRSPFRSIRYESLTETNFSFFRLAMRLGLHTGTALLSWRNSCRRSATPCGRLSSSASRGILWRSTGRTATTQVSWKLFLSRQD